MPRLSVGDYREAEILTAFKRTLGAVAFGAIAVGATIGGITPAHAAGPVAVYVFSPKPIAADGTLAAGTTVAVTVTAEDATGAVVPGAIIYLDFASGGGSAAVGTTSLSPALQPFTADSNGVVSITYQTAPTAPSSTHDKITAQDAASAPTITANDEYSYTTVARYLMRPKPIARTGTLGGAATVTITLTAFNGTGAVAPNAVVYLSFSQSTGGGSASARKTPLSATARRFTVNAHGTLMIIYKVPATLPAAGGTDTVTATNAASHSLVVTNDSYTF